MARGEVGCSAEVDVMFLVGNGILFLVRLGLARGSEGGAGGSRGVFEFGTGSEGPRLFSCASSSLGTGIWAGKTSVLYIEASTVDNIVFERPSAEREGSLSAARRAFHLI